MKSGSLTNTRFTGTRQSLVRRAGLAVAGLAAAAFISGCETDSFLDPSVYGRWEYTPTVVPILDRLSSIEDETGDFVQSSSVQPADLVPEAEQYRFGPGDQIDVRIRDYFVIGQEETFDRVIDSRGNLDIPRLPPVRAQGRSVQELTTAIEDAIRQQRINERAVVGIQIKSQRKQTYSVLGAVRTPSTYYVPSPDYRLLEAITTAGGFDESIPYVFVIRQVYLSDEAAGIPPAPEPVGQSTPGRPRVSPAAPDRSTKPDEDLIKLIDELSKQPGKDPSAPPPPSAPPDHPAQPGTPPPNPSLFAPPDSQPAAPTRAPGDPERARPPAQPPIDLPDAGTPQPAPASSDGATRPGWVYIDGRWVRTGGTPTGAAGADTTRPQSTQRVIKVPTGPLFAGAADVNIVIRPGDVIRVPPPATGLVYMAGAVARPGPYSLPAEGRLTLLRAIDSAGGLNGIAIPERTDITRRIGDDRQATIRVNLRAIAEGTQPDIALKRDDRINLGTNFFATPLAVLRNGFRASYGFGFILDRNFQGELFGPDQATQSNRF